jgi:hypothetical protein
LLFLQNYFVEASPIRRAIEDTYPTSSWLIDQLADPNISPSDAIFDLLSKSPFISEVMLRLIPEFSSKLIRFEPILKDLNVKELSGTDMEIHGPEAHEEIIQRLGSYLYYQGLATISSSSPNSYDLNGLSDEQLRQVEVRMRSGNTRSISVIEEYTLRQCQNYIDSREIRTPMRGFSVLQICGRILVSECH